jgi:tRNA(Glu) U13 pseudouridine synthase TruD
MDATLGKLWLEVLQERSLSPEMFALPELQKAYFGSFERPSLVFPGGVKTLAEPEKGGYKVTLSFSLPRGSYATFFIKYIGIL